MLFYSFEFIYAFSYCEHFHRLIFRSMNIGFRILIRNQFIKCSTDAVDKFFFSFCSKYVLHPLMFIKYNSVKNVHIQFSRCLQRIKNTLCNTSEKNGFCQHLFLKNLKFFLVFHCINNISEFLQHIIKYFTGSLF